MPESQYAPEPEDPALIAEVICECGHPESEHRRVDDGDGYIDEWCDGVDSHGHACQWKCSPDIFVGLRDVGGEA